MLYSESGASGHSTKNFITKAGGARGVLKIQLNQKELRLTTSLFFKPFAKLYDCYHIIPLSDITAIQLNNKWISIQFMKNGKAREVAIKSKQPSELLKHLQQLID